MKNIFKKTNGKLRILLPVIASFLAVILLFGVTFAIYTSVNKVKRVVSTQSGNGELFSSNYLALYKTDILSDPEYKIVTSNISINSGASTVTAFVNVCNYAQSSRTRWTTEKIVYDITFTLVSDDPIGDRYTKYKINDTAFTGTSLTISNQELEGNTSNHKIYTISTTDEDYTNMRIRITATVNGSSLAFTGYSLDGEICFNQYVIDNLTWDGYFAEYNNDDDALTSEFAGFNYVLSGRGEGTATITWNNTMLSMSKISWAELGITGAYDENASTASFPITNDFDGFQVQFYRKQKPADDEKWSDVNNYVNMEFISE